MIKHWELKQLESPNRFRANLQKIAKKDLIENNIGVILDADDQENVYASDKAEHIMIEGPTGCGKTNAVILPTIIGLSTSEKPSMVINDFNGMLYRNSYGFLKKQGYKVYFHDFRNPEKSDSYNLLAQAYKHYCLGETHRYEECISILSEAIMQDQIQSCKDIFWPYSAKTLFEGLCHILFTEGTPDKINIGNIYYQLQNNFNNKGGSSIAKQYIDLVEKTNIGRLKIYDAANTANDTRAGITSTLNMSLSPFIQTNEIKNMQLYCDYQPSHLATSKSPIAVFLGMPDEHNIYAPILSAIISDLYVALIKVANDRPNGRLKRPIYFILDELSNLPRIPHLEQKISASRQRNIFFIFATQDISQLSSKYDINTLLTNVGTRIFFGSKNADELERLSYSCGNIDDSSERRVPVSLLRQLNSAQALIIRDGYEPYITESKLPMFYDFPNRNKIKLEIPENKKCDREFIPFELGEIIREKWLSAVLPSSVKTPEVFSIDELFNTMENEKSEKESASFTVKKIANILHFIEIQNTNFKEKFPNSPIESIVDWEDVISDSLQIYINMKKSNTVAHEIAKILVESLVQKKLNDSDITAIATLLCIINLKFNFEESLAKEKCSLTSEFYDIYCNEDILNKNDASEIEKAVYGAIKHNIESNKENLNEIFWSDVVSLKEKASEANKFYMDIELKNLGFMCLHLLDKLSESCHVHSLSNIPDIYINRARQIVNDNRLK